MMRITSPSPGKESPGFKQSPAGRYGATNRRTIPRKWITYVLAFVAVGSIFHYFPSFSTLEISPSTTNPLPSPERLQMPEEPERIIAPVSSTPFIQVLDKIVVDAALQYNPDSRHLDIGYHAQQTSIMVDLIRLYRQLDNSTSAGERKAIRDAIDTMQQILYPWITKSTNGPPRYRSILDLMETWTEEAGIVVTIGKNGGYRWGVHQLVHLRGNLKCTLPIEIYYAGEEDLPRAYREFIEAISATYPGRITLIDILDLFPDPDGQAGLPGGWAMRPFAMLASSFNTVILADADTVFLQDPRVILNEPSMRESGSIFWHDRVIKPAKPAAYDVLEELLELSKAKGMERVKQESAPWFNRQTRDEQESGLLVIDKTRSLGGMLETCHLNSKNAREQVVYEIISAGDKETYWIAHALTSTSYHWVPGYLGALGVITRDVNTGKETICTSNLLHVLESTGEPFWFNSGIMEFKWWNNAVYIDAQGWIGHNAQWYEGVTKYSQSCALMPNGEELITRVEGEMKRRIQQAIELAKKYDALMTQAGLISING